VLAVLGLGHDVPSLARLEDRAETRAYDLMIVGDQDARHERPQTQSQAMSGHQPGSSFGRSFNIVPPINIMKNPETRVRKSRKCRAAVAPADASAWTIALKTLQN